MEYQTQLTSLSNRLISLAVSIPTCSFKYCYTYREAVEKIKDSYGGYNTSTIKFSFLLKSNINQKESSKEYLNTNLVRYSGFIDKITQKNISKPMQYYSSNGKFDIPTLSKTYVTVNISDPGYPLYLSSYNVFNNITYIKLDMDDYNHTWLILRDGY